jgi:hypothetical protein
LTVHQNVSNQELRELEQVRERLGEVDRELASHGHTVRATEHRSAIEQLCARFERRYEALGDARTAALTLQGITSPKEVLGRIPQALTAGASFDRAIVSTVEEGALIPYAVQFKAHLGATRAQREGSSEAAERVLARLRDAPIRI